MWSLCSCLKEPLAIPAQLVSNENGVSKEKPRAEAHTSGATSSDTQHEAGKRNQRPLAETGSSEGNATNYAGQPPAVSAAISEERELCEKRRGQGATASTAEGSVVLPGVPTGEPAEASQIQQRFSFSELGDLRNSSYGKVLPEGKCLYIQCGDPSDFDGYLIARAGEVLSMTTRDMIFAVVVPEERSENRNVAIPDARAEVSLDICGRMLRSLCPTAQVVRGPLNERNIFALMNAPDKYKPALMSVGDAEGTELAELCLESPEDSRASRDPPAAARTLPNSMRDRFFCFFSPQIPERGFSSEDASFAQKSGEDHAWAEGS